jgi:hypothetical protein
VVSMVSTGAGSGMVATNKNSSKVVFHVTGELEIK